MKDKFEHWWNTCKTSEYFDGRSDYDILKKCMENAFLAGSVAAFNAALDKVRKENGK
mgnify:CR=1 FL=1